MEKFLTALSKVFTISLSCNVVTAFVKACIVKDMDLQQYFSALQNFGMFTRGGVIDTSYLVSTIPALVGYEVGSMVDNSIAKQVLSVVSALTLTACTECFSKDHGLITTKPAVDNFKLWTNREQINFLALKELTRLKYEKCEIVDFVNTFIQTELFNIFLPNSVDNPEVFTDDFATQASMRDIND